VEEETTNDDDEDDEMQTQSGQEIETKEENED
jgi:hypothetical protein